MRVVLACADSLLLVIKPTPNNVMVRQNLYLGNNFQNGKLKTAQGAAERLICLGLFVLSSNSVRATTCALLRIL